MCSVGGSARRGAQAPFYTEETRGGSHRRRHPPKTKTVWLFTRAPVSLGCVFSRGRPKTHLVRQRGHQLSETGAGVKNHTVFVFGGWRLQRHPSRASLCRTTLTRLFVRRLRRYTPCPQTLFFRPCQPPLKPTSVCTTGNGMPTGHQKTNKRVLKTFAGSYAMWRSLQAQ